MAYLACVLDTIGANYILLYGSAFIERGSLQVLKYDMQGLFNKYKYNRNMIYKEAEFGKRQFVVYRRSKPECMSICSKVHIYMFICR